MNTEFILRGSRADIKKLREWLSQNMREDEYSLLEEQKVHKSITDRRPLQQVELFDVVLHLLEGVVASAIYDVIKIYSINLIDEKKLKSQQALNASKDADSPSPLSSPPSK